MGISKYYIPCTRKSPTETLNSKLVPIKTYATTTINGYIGSGNNANTPINVGDKETFETRYKFYCDDFNLKIGDLIIYEGKTYEVTTDPKNTAHRNHHIKTFIRKVDQVKQE